MLNNKTPLSSVVQALSLAAANANERLHTEYISATKRLKGNGQDALLTLPPPLSVSSVRVTFSAHVSKAERTASRETGDLMLDFSKPGGNFQGEIELRPYDPELSGDDCADREAAPENAGRDFENPVPPSRQFGRKD